MTETRRRLSPGTRKAVLATHLISMGAWIGVDAALAVLIVTGLLAAPGTAAIAFQALPLLIVPMLVASLVCLVSGLILGLTAATASSGTGGSRSSSRSTSCSPR